VNCVLGSNLASGKLKVESREWKVDFSLAIYLECCHEFVQSTDEREINRQREREREMACV